MLQIQEQKKQLRKRLISERCAISSEERIQAAVSAANQLIHSHVFKASQHIACYLARSDEFDCQSVMEMIWQSKKQCYLPVISDDTLRFLHYDRDDILQPNQFNILEPIGTPEIAPDQLDLVIVPLVGFDMQGHRLGMGAGYYDRTFAFLQQQSRTKTFLMGLAYDSQQAESLPADSWDIPLDGILTEKRIVVFHPSYP